MLSVMLNGKLSVIIALSLIFMGSAANKADTVSIYETSINRDLKNYLAKEMPGWSFPSPKRWETVWFDSYKKDGNLVNYVSGDFNCDRKPDFAFILGKEDGSIGAWMAIREKKTFSKIEILPGRSIKGDEFISFGLSLGKPGKYKSFETAGEQKIIKIRCDTVSVDHFERAAETYYLEGGKLKSLITGD